MLMLIAVHNHRISADLDRTTIVCRLDFLHIRNAQPPADDGPARCYSMTLARASQPQLRCARTKTSTDAGHRESRSSVAREEERFMRVETACGL